MFIVHLKHAVELYWLCIHYDIRKWYAKQYFSIRKMFIYWWPAWPSILQHIYVRCVYICRVLKNFSNIWNSYTNWQMLTQRHMLFVYGNWFLVVLVTHFQCCRLFIVECFNHCESEFIYTHRNFMELSQGWRKFHIHTHIYGCYSHTQSSHFIRILYCVKQSNYVREVLYL